MLFLFFLLAVRDWTGSAFIGILAYDAYSAMWFTESLVGQPYADGGVHFGIGVGTLVLALNAVFLGCYTFGCHSLRHLVGGRKDCVSTAPLGKNTYDCVSCLNSKHMLWAWTSLFWVGFSDFYVRMCSMGVFTDMRFF